MLQQALFPELKTEEPEEKAAAYDVTESTNKRRVVTISTSSEDNILKTADRQKIKNTILGQHRNFSLIHWAITKVIDYNTSFKFQAKTANEKFNKDLEKLIKKQSKAENCDISERRDLETFLRCLYAGTLTDGDSSGMKCANAKMQGIEGDRIKTPGTGLPGTYNKADFIHGIKYNANGKPIQVIICKRKKKSLVFERVVNAKNMMTMVDLTRFDQGRGVSPLTAAANLAQDIYEGIDAYAIKAKLVAWAGMVITRGGESKTSPFRPTQTSGTNQAGEETIEYEIPDGSNGPFVLDMEQDDDVKIVESKTPPVEHMQHVSMVIKLILLALDIPYTFYDQTKGSFTIQKDAWTQWEIASRKRRRPVNTFLDQWTQWQIAIAIASGELIIPADVDMEDLVYEWQHCGRPWMDVKELDIDINAAKMGFDSVVRIIKSKGLDPETVVKENAWYYKLMKDAGLPTTEWDEKTTNISINQEKDTDE